MMREKFIFAIHVGEKTLSVKNCPTDYSGVRSTEKMTYILLGRWMSYV